MEQYRKYKIPIFYGDFTVVISKNYSNIKDVFKKLNIETKQEFDAERYDAFAFTEPRYNLDRYFIFIRPDTKPGQIAHECKHIVNWIFDHTRIKLDPDNDECECYLLGWLVNKAHDFQDKLKSNK